MASNSAITSSAALIGLKDELTLLSETLHGICQQMESDMSQLGEVWRDRKYQEFVQGYKTQIKECENISVRYKQWCTEKLVPKINSIVAIEEANVSGESFSFGDVVGAALGGAAVGGVVGSSNIGVGASDNDTGNGVAPLNSNVVQEESSRRPVEELTESELLEEMSPWQRESYLKLKKEITDEYEYELFKAEDISNMSHEMQMDGAKFAGAAHAIRAENIREKAENEYQKWMERLDRGARKCVQNNRERGFVPEQMVSGVDESGYSSGEYSADVAGTPVADEGGGNGIKTDVPNNDTSAEPVKEWVASPANRAGSIFERDRVAHEYECKPVKSDQDYNVKFKIGKSIQAGQEESHGIQGGLSGKVKGVDVGVKSSETTRVGSSMKESGNATAYAKCEKVESKSFTPVKDMAFDDVYNELPQEKKKYFQAEKEKLLQKKDQDVHDILSNPYRSGLSDLHQFKRIEESYNKKEQELENSMRQELQNLRSEGVVPVSNPKKKSIPDLRCELIHQGEPIPEGKVWQGSMGTKSSHDSMIDRDTMNQLKYEQDHQASVNINALGASKSSKEYINETDVVNEESYINCDLVDE